ncbi:MAG: cellulase family glycosylhydrolase [Chthonomonadales bacterium]|nr:cellulase family glycosylhydrolase [Chthonomonadales bacterium]
MILLRFLAAVLLGIGVVAVDASGAPDEAQSALQLGSILYETGFEGAEPLAGWIGPASIVPGRSGGQSIHVVRKPGEERGSTLFRPLDARALRGHTLLCAAWVRASDVSEKPNTWNGIKVMLAIEAPSGSMWPQADLGTGSFDWRPVRFTVRVPDDAEKINLHLGLELVTGEVWFDDVRVSVPQLPEGPPPPPARRRYRGHDLPRLRGAMINPKTVTEEDLRTLGVVWKANLVRWQLTYPAPSGRSISADDWDRWLEEELQRLDAMLPLCRKYGLYIALDLHSPPGGRGTAGGYAGSDSGLFTDRAAQDQFVRAWEGMARRYKGNRTIWGFDLANEPVENAWDGTCDNWHALVERTARAIRRIDPSRTLIVEPTLGGEPAGLAWFRPISASNVVYSVHMYRPHEFTHQNVFAPGPAVRYPGAIRGVMWDRAAIRKALEPAVQFQKAYNVQIYVGEFSAIRWAPDDSAYRYLRDLIEVMEELGWDWSYHAFREWDGWSVEHGPEKGNHQKATEPTSREKLLREWFSKNRRPSFSGRP